MLCFEKLSGTFSMLALIAAQTTNVGTKPGEVNQGPFIGNNMRWCSPSAFQPG